MTSEISNHECIERNLLDWLTRGKVWGTLICQNLIIENLRHIKCKAYKVPSYVFLRRFIFRFLLLRVGRLSRLSKIFSRLRCETEVVCSWSLASSARSMRSTYSDFKEVNPVFLYFAWFWRIEWWFESGGILWFCATPELILPDPLVFELGTRSEVFPE